MAGEIEEIANLLGAKIIGQVPDFGGGAFAAAQLAKMYQNRMEEMRHEKPTENGPVLRNLEIPVPETTFIALESLAEVLSTPSQRIEPKQLAAGLIKGAAIQIVNQLLSQSESDQTGAEEKLKQAKAGLLSWGT